MFVLGLKGEGFADLTKNSSRQLRSNREVGLQLGYFRCARHRLTWRKQLVLEVDHNAWKHRFITSGTVSFSQLTMTAVAETKSENQSSEMRPRVQTCNL